MLLAANISLLYNSLSIDKSLNAAAQDGFSWIEILAPYEHAPQWYADQLAQTGLKLSLINTPGVQPEHPMGLAAQPDQVATFQKSMGQAAAVCEATGCRCVHVLAGWQREDYSVRQQRDVLLDNLRWAHERFPDLTLHLEGLNRYDVPNYFYYRPDQVADVLTALTGLPVGMQFDFYHVVREGLAITSQLARHWAHVVHVQVAGAPARHEPDTSRDGMMEGFQALNELDYGGLVGLEYRPASGVAADGLHWLEPLKQQGLVRFT